MKNTQANNLTKRNRASKKDRSSRSLTCSAPLVVLPLGTEAETVAAVREAGYVPILTDSPEKVKIIVPAADVVGGDLLMAAMHAVSKVSTASAGRDYFVEELWKRMKDREAAQNDKMIH